MNDSVIIIGGWPRKDPPRPIDAASGDDAMTKCENCGQEAGVLPVDIKQVVHIPEAEGAIATRWERRLCCGCRERLKHTISHAMGVDGKTTL